MLLAGEDSIRDVIAFPKTQQARCLLTDASAVDQKQLKELHVCLDIQTQTSLRREGRNPDLTPSLTYIARMYIELGSSVTLL